VKINLELNDLKSLYWAADVTGAPAYSSNPNGLSVGDLVSASLFVDYVYLDTDERRRFAQVSHEYLIEQLQFTGDESTSTTNTKVKLNFNHPTKEIVWVVQPYDNVDWVKSAPYYGPQHFNYTDDFDPTYTASSSFSVSDAYGGIVDPNATQYDTVNLAGGLPGVAAGGANHVFVPTSFEGGDNPVSVAKIQLNGHDRFAEMDGRYFNLVQPFQHHENIPSRGINVYSFGLKPEEHQPSGTCNFSRIDAANLNLTLTAQTVNYNGSPRTSAIRVFAVNYNVLRIMSGMGIRKAAHKSMQASRFMKPATSSNCGKLLINKGYQSVKIPLFWTIRSQAWLIPRRSREQMEMGTLKSLRYVPTLMKGPRVLQLRSLSSCCVKHSSYLSFYSDTIRLSQYIKI
jgi:hypothetical protein